MDQALVSRRDRVSLWLRAVCVMISLTAENKNKQMHTYPLTDTYLPTHTHTHTQLLLRHAQEPKKCHPEASIAQGKIRLYHGTKFYSHTYTYNTYSHIYTHALTQQYDPVVRQHVLFTETKLK